MLQSQPLSLLGLTLGLGGLDFSQMSGGIWKLNGLTTPFIYLGLNLFNATSPIFVQDWKGMYSRVPRRDLVVTKCNGAKIATAQTRLIDLENPQLRGF